MPRPKKIKKLYEELSADDQVKLNELAHESVIFRRSRTEFDALVEKVFKNTVDTNSARTRLKAANEAFGANPPRVQNEERNAQRERVLSHIKKAESTGQLMAVAKLESLYADLMGTREPIKVEHVIKGTILQVVESLTPERQAEIIASQRRAYELAAMAEREGLARSLPAPKIQVIDAEIVESEQKIA